MVDVYFYMANNYANMEDYETAEEMAIRYLEESQQGVYAEEAEELLDYIYFELDLPPRRFVENSPDSVYVRHETARKSLEEGRFLEALQILKEIVKSNPTFMPAWNNLSLAYYYIGDFDEAMRTIERTLEQEPGNLHALCNLAVLLSHHNRVSELVSLLSKLKKVVPFHHEHIYKLATTMGVLGQHEEAFRLYLRMIRTAPPQEACTYHYAAISAYLSGRKEHAARWWQKVKQLDPHAGIADYYLQMLKDQEGEKSGVHESIPYNYCQPNANQPADKLNATCVEDFKADPMIRASLLWALQHGREDVKQTVIQTLAMIGDDEAEAAIRHFCKTTSNQQLQKLALIALAEMGADLPYEICNSFSRPMQEDRVTASIKLRLPEKEQAELRNWSLQLWQYYKEKETPLQVRKEEAWIAALEYLYGKKRKQKQSQSEVAKKYGVSPTTVAKCIKALSALDLNQF
jgi:tetratricopeptide (TPR) repeat protein